MSFQPVLPMGGYAGWSFLTRTLPAQQAAHDNSPAIARETDYFMERIGKINSAEDLISDRSLLGVALGAFGLGADIDNKYFIKKVLQDGTLDPKALANRLTDKRYFEFAKAFGFGDFATPRTALSNFGQEISAAYKRQQFETAVGSQNEGFRLALGFGTAVSKISRQATGSDTAWFRVMGNPPVRKVFELAFGLPTSFGALDVERQLETFKEKSQARFGDSSVSQFNDPEKQDELIRLFLLRSDNSSAGQNMLGGQIALSLLQGASAMYRQI